MAGKHIFGEEKLRSEIKNKLKSGLKNEDFAKRLSSKSTRNSIGDPISLLLALLTIIFLTFMTTSTYMLGGKKSRILGGHGTTTKGKKVVTFLLVHSEMTVWSKKNNNQSLIETCFPGIFSNSIASSVKQICISTRVIRVL